MTRGTSPALCGSYLETIEQQNIDLREHVARLEAELAKVKPPRVRLARTEPTPIRSGPVNALERALMAPTMGRVQITAKTVVDGEAWRIESPAGVVQFSPSEWLLLQKLLSERGRMVSRRALAALIEDNTEKPEHLLNVRMAYLRRKLTRSGVAYLLTTIPLRGYRFELDS